MYPNARVDGNPGGADWKSKLPEALKNKVPEGADSFYKDGDVYIFTKGGNVISGGKYNADGSVFTAKPSSSSNMPTINDNQITQGIMQQGGSIFGAGFGAGTGVDLNSSFMGGGYNINTNKLMGSAGLLGAASMLASEAPLGLGGLLGSLAMPGIMAGFMKSLSFNFDFSNMFTSAQSGTGTGTGTGTLPEGFEQTALAGVYKKDGKFYKKDDNGNWLQCDDTGKIKDEAKLPTGYEKTATEGVYKKGEEYIKYDAETRTYVACNADGTKKADAPAADKPATETPVAEKPAEKPAAEEPAAETPAADKPAAKTPTRSRTSHVNGDGYSVSRHSNRVFYKSEGGSTKYYVKNGNKYTQVSDYDGKTYKLNGKLYDAKTGNQIETKQERQQKENRQRIQRIQVSVDEQAQRTTFAADSTRVVRPIVP